MIGSPGGVVVVALLGRVALVVAPCELVAAGGGVMRVAGGGMLVLCGGWAACGLLARGMFFGELGAVLEYLGHLVEYGPQSAPRGLRVISGRRLRRGSEPGAERDRVGQQSAGTFSQRASACPELVGRRADSARVGAQMFG